MTPKEKAEELRQKFYPCTMDFAIDQEGTHYAIQCALICVDEIIKACEYNHVESYNTDWWQQVKQELEKL